MYISPQPIIDLEKWFYSEIKKVLPSEIFLVISYPDSDKHQAVPSNLVKISYIGSSSNESEMSLRFTIKFEIDYQVASPTTLLAHHSALQLVEKVREHLWELLPPRPADSYPLQLLKEEPYTPKDKCGCIAYKQVWGASQKIPRLLVPNADPCMGAGEPGAVLPEPEGFVAVFEQDPRYILILNKDYDSSLPISNGQNQPWTYSAGIWTLASQYDSDLATFWGNIPFILTKSSVNLSVSYK